MTGSKRVLLVCRTAVSGKMLVGALAHMHDELGSTAPPMRR